MTTLPTPQRELAFETLEKSFNDASNFKTHKPLPRRRDEAQSFFPSAHPIRTTSDSDDDTSTGCSAQDDTPLASPSLIHTQDPAALPPTPPSTNSQENVPRTEQTPPPFADGTMANFLSKKSSMTTPSTQRSPPTPDPSPPRTANSVAPVQRPPVLQYPSSRAESFKTAREDQSSTADTQSDGGLDDIPGLGYFGSPRPMLKRDATVGFRNESKERDDKGSTGNGHATSPQPYRARAPSAALTTDDAPAEEFQNLNDIPNREWDTNLMRNVTVRRKRPSRRPKTPPKQADPADQLSYSPTSIKRDFSMRKRLQKEGDPSQSPAIKHSSPQDWPAELKMRLKDHLRDPDARRYSGSSFTSTVVEAVVVSTPQHRQHSLRHAGKNLAYRAVSEGSSSELSNRTRSYRASPSTDDSPSRRLHHQRVRLPETRDRNSISSEISLDTTSTKPSVPAKQALETIPVVVVPKRRTVLQPPAEIKPRSRPVSGTSRSNNSRPESDDLGITIPLESSLKHSQRAERPGFQKIRDQPTRVKLAAPPAMAPSPVPVQALGERQIPTPPAARAVPALVDEACDDRVARTPPAENASQSHSPAETFKEQPVQVPDGETAAPKTGNAESNTLADATPKVTESPQIQEPIAKSRPSPELVTTADNASENQRVDRPKPNEQSSSSGSLEGRGRVSIAPTEDISRPSFEEAGGNLHPDDHKRMSSDRSTVRTDDLLYPNRHLLTPGTPFSHISTTPDALEVREATAVSIFPHNNHSLLVVQQSAPSRSTTVSQRGTVDGTTTSLGLQTRSLSPPTLTLAPSTPTQTGMAPPTACVDSPLRNPRKPPIPPTPAIKFIPPTPAEEVDRQLMVGPNDSSNIRRRLSLKERARRYSDNIIAPVMARIPSTGHRRTASNPPARRRNAPSVSQEKDNRLHPFWRPRGFWDDFSDSDSDSEFGDFETDRLPEGGDTSNVGEEMEEPGKKGINALGRRLTNGFRGSGGFLIGNSLGIERGPTNRRRHHISLPSGLVPRKNRPAPRTSAPVTNTASKVVPDPPAAPAPPTRAATPPRIMMTAPTFRPENSTVLGTSVLRGNAPRRVEKRTSLYSIPNRSFFNASPVSTIRARTSRIRRLRSGLKRAHKLPGLGLEIQYVGIQGMRDRWAEKKAEKRRQVLRERIGSRWVVENNGVI